MERNNVYAIKYFITILILSVSIGAYGQQFEIEKLYNEVADLTAVTSPRVDLNSKPCALLKVQIPLRGISFEGNVIGNVEFKSGEYWVYLSEGSKNILVKHESKSPTRINFIDYGIPCVSSRQTYVLKLKNPGPATSSYTNGNTILTPEQQSKIAHLSLAARNNGKIFYFSKKIWDSISEKFRYEKIGVVVYVSEIPFIVDLSDSSNEINWKNANKKYGQFLPTINQANDIVSCFSSLDKAITGFGGESISKQYYWTKEPSYGGWHETIDSWTYSNSNKATISSKPDSDSYHRSVRKIFPIE